MHRATLGGPDLEAVELAGIVHDGLSGPIEIALAAIPPVTLDVTPEAPSAGGEASIHYWGAPVGENWLALAVAGAPVGDYMVRLPAPGPEGEVFLRLPDSPRIPSPM